jgi:hypothetical protein
MKYPICQKPDKIVERSIAQQRTLPFESRDDEPAHESDRPCRKRSWLSEMFD